MSKHAWWKGKLRKEDGNDPLYKDLKKAWDLVTEGDIKPECFWYEGKMYSLVKGRWRKGHWVEEHYEAVDDS